MLKFLEGGDEVDMEVQVFELGKGLQVFGDGSEAVVGKVEPDELLPSVGQKGLQCFWQSLERGQLVVPEEQRSGLDF